MKTTTPITHDLISARAHQIWEKAGCPDGGNLGHWLQAEHELHGEHKAGEANSETRSVEPTSTGKHSAQKAPHRANYVHPGITTDSLHHHRKG